MKNRKFVVVAFLLVAVLLLGVGYAALSDTLDITGSADVNQSAAEEAFNEDVYFSAAVANEDGNTASINGDNNDKASFTATGFTRNQTTKFCFYANAHSVRHFNDLLRQSKVFFCQGASPSVLV
jgi:hypothetical protein